MMYQTAYIDLRAELDQDDFIAFGNMLASSSEWTVNLDYRDEESTEATHIVAWRPVDTRTGEVR